MTDIANRDREPLRVLWEGIDVAMASLRAQHPVSILDLTPQDGFALDLALRLRTLPRKVHIISYAWREMKQRERGLGLPPILIEKGSLPGLHYSKASFDMVIGVGVLSALKPHERVHALTEIRRTALRHVILAERLPNGSDEAAISEGDLIDALTQSGNRDALVMANRELVRVWIDLGVLAKAA